jgi:hypothetical protein
LIFWGKHYYCLLQHFITKSKNHYAQNKAQSNSITKTKQSSFKAPHRKLISGFAFRFSVSEFKSA